MAILKFPEFTPAARDFWAAIPLPAREQILTNCFCSKCRDTVTIFDYSGALLDKGGDLLLKGKCAACGHAVARLAERD